MGVFVQLNGDSPQAKSNPVGYVIEENGCWSWVGKHDRKGYGMWVTDGECYAHRVLYKRHKGPIPRGLQLDHLCRKRDCVNPDHVEPVTPKVNTARGLSRKFHMGKTIKIAPAVRDEVAKAVAGGESCTTWARKLGVDESTVRAWHRRRTRSEP